MEMKDKETRYEKLSRLQFVLENAKQFNREAQEDSKAVFRIPKAITDDLTSVINKFIKSDYNMNLMTELALRNLDTYEKKNHDYGNAFDKSLDEDGLLVAKIRMSDKMQRFASLLKKDNFLVESESIEDTLMDLSNYALMTAAWIIKNKK